MRSIHRYVSLALMLFGLGFPGSAHAAAPVQWSKVQTPEFVVLSESGGRDLIEFAVGYSAFRQGLREFFKPATSLPPTTVLLFRRQEQMAPYLPEMSDRTIKLNCFSTEVDREALVAISLSGDRTQALDACMNSTPAGRCGGSDI